MTAAPVNVYQEILAWARTRPVWQQDALRRLATKGMLNDSDFAELVSLCLAGRGVAQASVAPAPLDAAHLPNQGPVSETVTILKLCGVKNVGALLADQTLTFVPTGLTVVYGDNGSGKSSYARVLKRLCRARGSQEALRANVFAGSANPPSPPSATVEAVVGTQPATTQWQDGFPPPPHLSQVAVFDQSAATAYISEKQDASIRPAGLDLLTKLVCACDAVRTRIQWQISAASAYAKPIQGLAPGTAAAAFAASLSAKTTDAEIVAATTVTHEQVARSEFLRTESTRLDAQDPRRAARDLQMRAARIESLRKRVDGIESVLSPGSVSRLLTALQEARKAQQAADLASKLSFDGSNVLPGVGTDIWRRLWEAARNYSTQAAYPGTSFPVRAPGARCVLCHQPLALEAQERLRQFERFVTDSTAKEAASAAARLDTERARFAGLVIAAPDDATLLQELEDARAGLAQSTRSFLEAAEIVRQAVLQVLTENTPVPTANLGKDHSTRLGECVTALNAQASTLLTTDQPALRAQLAREHSELAARIALSQRKADLLSQAKALRSVAALEGCLAEVDTTGITRKTSDLTKKAVTDTLKDAFLDERKWLGLDALPVELEAAGGTRGLLYHQLTLHGVKGKIGPSDILSEGEQRACSFASFMSEARLAVGKSAVIFDDPVSSFDHLRRDKVANRLASEARDRQVIVFTHDAVFMLALIKAAEDWTASCEIRHVQRAGTQVGYCSDTPPWIGMKVKARIGYLKNEWVKAEKLYRTGDRGTYNAVAKNLYGLLRESWERAVEETLFGGAIERLRLSIETKKLKEVDVVPADYEQVERGMSKCSALFVGHDQPAAVNSPAPAPEELHGDIGELETWINSITQRRKRNNAPPQAA